jgi:hypothetical protein
VYELAFPDAPFNYERLATWFLAAKNPQARFAFFIFEGNDFVAEHRVHIPGLSDVVMPRSVAQVLDSYDAYRGAFLGRWVSELRYPLLLFGMSRRAERMLLPRDDSRAVVFRVGSEPVGLLRSQLEAALDPDPSLYVELDPALVQHIDCVFFVPSKARAYAHFLPTAWQRMLPQPAPGVGVLQRVYGSRGVRVVDLTPALVEAAQTLVPRGHHIYWRDDTHWNGEGMRAAAPVVAACLSAGPRPADGRDAPELRLADGWPSDEAGPLAWGHLRAVMNKVSFEDESYVIHGRIKHRGTGPENVRLVAFVGDRKVTSVHTRDEEEPAGIFEVAVPRNFIEEGREPVRVFAVAGREATEIPLSPNQLRLLHRGPT